MNSLNIITTKVDQVIGATPPSSPRDADTLVRNHHPVTSGSDDAANLLHQETSDPADVPFDPYSLVTQAIPQGHYEAIFTENEKLRERGLAQRFAMAILHPFIVTFRIVSKGCRISSQWLVSCVYDEERAQYSPLLPIYKLLRFMRGGKRRKPLVHETFLEKQPLLNQTGRPDQAGGGYGIYENVDGTESVESLHEKHGRPISQSKVRPVSAASTPSISLDDIQPRRSIRIKLYNEESRHSDIPSNGEGSSTLRSPPQPINPANLKSPTSPSSSLLRLTRYPRNPTPPRPLLPRFIAPDRRKTLILDLDETLIHSMAKGGRMTSGHMVEVRLGGLTTGLPILYYVRKRPFCDEFLKKVHKWYNLVIFTASVQEYADPVIDWLEQSQGQKFFSNRYYRQHCTQRNGAYIKDIASIEPDLSKVMILDNSPLSYCFHEDNAIPCEGWISDPTDKELLHLIPLLQALTYTTDVRALLALRMGEPAI